MIDPKTKKAVIVAPTRLTTTSSKLATTDVNKINSVTAFNTKRRGVEAMAKTDSIAAAKKASFNSKDLVDQRRAGNAAANATRLAGGNPKVARGRTYTGSSTETDKYAPDGSKPSVDFYSRTNPLEKNHKVFKPVAVVKSKKGTKLMPSKDSGCGCSSGKMENGGSFLATRLAEKVSQNWPSVVAAANSRNQQPARMFSRGGDVTAIDEESPIRHNR